MRLYVPVAEAPLERDSRVSGRIQRPITDDAMRKDLVTKFEMVHELAVRLPSNARRQHSVETANPVAHDEASTACMLEPGLKDRTKRQKNGESPRSICRPGAPLFLWGIS